MKEFEKQEIKDAIADYRQVIGLPTRTIIKNRLYWIRVCDGEPVPAKTGTGLGIFGADLLALFQPSCNPSRVTK